MKTLFLTADAEEILRRIHALRPDSAARWGRMNVAQMLAHCQAPLKVALGELKLRRSLIGFLFGRLARKKLAGDQPFGKDLPTAKPFLVQDERDFAIEKANLIALLERLRRGGTEGLTRAPHPFFGPLTTAEWERLLWKHLDHHLQQFGA